MTGGDSRIVHLLEVALDSGATPEEVCADCPELVPELRERIRRCRGLEAQIEALFPARPPGSLPGSTGGRRAPDPGPDLPAIPGYRVQAVLGRGGMGVVYRAVHLKLGRTVAVKMILSGAYARRAEFARFLREARDVASLRHPHVVQVHDAGDLDGLPYFTMEYVEGGHLGQKLAGTPQSAARAADLVAALADAVQAAHDAGIVHRDLKPANVLLTADGVPKITDFGLARHFGEGDDDGDGGDEDLTLSGTRLGTPSYMAPEQAAGRTRAVGRAADVYALGAILYELLTGRPPFRAESAAATVLQVVSQEPAPPSRLNGKVPRDLETICLKCLSKDPARRYASAAALADDVRRFRAGRPIEARPVGWAGRALRWSRREPAAAGLLLAVLALIGLALGSWLRLERQQAAARAAAALQEGRTLQAVEAALAQAEDLEARGRWPEARTLLNGAPKLLGAAAPADLRGRLARMVADAAMVSELEDVRLRRRDGRKSRRAPFPSSDQFYAAAFASYGITPDASPASQSAARVRGSDIRETLLVFLHDWFVLAPDANRPKLRALLDAADDNAWRRAVRDARPGDAAALAALARRPEATDQAPVVLSGLANALAAAGRADEARDLLYRAQALHPGDFWINYQLGEFLLADRPREAVGYLRAAVAIRPENEPAHTLLARALRGAGEVERAIATYRQSIRLNPNGMAYKDLARALASTGRLAEARDVWEQGLAADPPDHEPWYGYAQLCLFLHEEDAYRRARAAMLARFADAPADWVIAERTSLASLLLPAAGDELRRAVSLADRAMADGPKPPDANYAYLQFLKGLCEYRQGRYERAIPWLAGAAERLPNRAGPGLVLAMAQFRAGRADEARRTLGAAVIRYDWIAAKADHPTAWVNHVFRREAESLILPNLGAFLSGENRPTSNDERLALLGACQSQGHYAAAAGLYADALAADPALADELTADCARRAASEADAGNRREALDSECRFLAARCAALAGCGLGRDGPALAEPERTRWRRQAREWLRADLAAWTKAPPAGADRGEVRRLANEMLTLWQSDADLARVREPDALQHLPAAERGEWTRLWGDVESALRDAK